MKKTGEGKEISQGGPPPAHTQTHRQKVRPGKMLAPTKTPTALGAVFGIIRDRHLYVNVN